MHLYRLKVYPVGLQDCRIDVCPVLVKAVKPPAAGLPGLFPAIQEANSLPDRLGKIRRLLLIEQAAKHHLPLKSSQLRIFIGAHDTQPNPEIRIQRIAYPVNANRLGETGQHGVHSITSSAGSFR